MIKKIVERLNQLFSKELEDLNQRELLKKKEKIFKVIYDIYSSESATEKSGIKKFDFDTNIEIWDKNWTFNVGGEVYSKIYNSYLVHKAGEFRLIKPGKFLLSPFMVNPKEDDSDTNFVNIQIKPFEVIQQSDGGIWNLLSGENYLGSTSIVRFYFNFEFKNQVEKFVKSINEELNSHLIPFNFKINSVDSKRTDAGILYIQREHYFITFFIISKLLKQNTTILRKDVPLFTKKLHSGLGFAEDPQDSKFSFGETISNEIASGYLESYIKKRIKNRDKFVSNYLRNRGYNIRELYRNSDTNYPYFFETSLSVKYIKENKCDTKKYNYANYALILGKIICKQAIIIMKNKAFNIFWLNAENDKEELDEIKYIIADESFENGRLGIIYFLAKLYSYFPTYLIFKFLCLKVIENLDIPNNNIVKEIKTFLDLKPQSISTINIKEIDIKKIIEGIDNKGVFSIFKDDVFNATIKSGYAGFGLRFLTIQNQNELNVFDQKLIHKLNMWNYNANFSSNF